jgi:hypothetical protein
MLCRFDDASGEVCAALPFLTPSNDNRQACVLLQLILFDLVFLYVQPTHHLNFFPNQHSQIAMVGMREESQAYLCCAVGEESFQAAATAALFGGILLMAILESVEHIIADCGKKPRGRRNAADRSGHEVGKKQGSEGAADEGGHTATLEQGSVSSPLLATLQSHPSVRTEASNAEVYAAGVWTCVGIALHNFVEGIAVYVVLAAEKGAGQALFYGAMVSAHQHHCAERTIILCRLIGIDLPLEESLTHLYRCIPFVFL